MEIERKFLVDPSKLPDHLDQYTKNELEQAYLTTEPVVRIRRKNDQFILTYKGAGLMCREEFEGTLTKEAYEKLLSKAEGNVISKTRYKIPETFQDKKLTIELDVFHGQFEGLYIAEVEFDHIEIANSYQPPKWFGKEVTEENTYHNSTLSMMSPEAITKMLSALKK